MQNSFNKDHIQSFAKHDSYYFQCSYPPPWLISEILDPLGFYHVPYEICYFYSVFSAGLPQMSYFQGKHKHLKPNGCETWELIYRELKVIFFSTFLFS